jgi:hypothetical protein
MLIYSSYSSQKKYRNILFIILAALCLALIPASAQADEGETLIPESTVIAPVIPPAEPTEVIIGLYLMALDGISAPSDSTPMFEAEMFMDLQWKDERLAFDAAEYGYDRKIYEEHAAEIELEQIWWPDIEIENSSHGRQTENLELIIFSDGTVEYEEKFVAMIHVDFDLKKFPFDEQILEIDIESFAWNHQDLVLVPNDKRIGFDPHYSSEEWSIDAISSEVKLEQEIRSDEAFSEFIYRIHAVRHSQFYLMKIAPMLLIIMLSWSVFWMEGEAASGRMGRSFIALLTVVAFHRVLSSFLPRLSYPTLLDGIVFVGYIYASIAIVENVMVHLRTRRDGAEQALKLDRLFQWLVPTSYVLVNIVLALYFLG